MSQKRDEQRAVENAVRDIKRRTRRKFSPEEKIRIVLQGLRGGCFLHPVLLGSHRNRGNRPWRSFPLPDDRENDQH